MEEGDSVEMEGSSNDPMRTKEEDSHHDNTSHDGENGEAVPPKKSPNDVWMEKRQMLLKKNKAYNERLKAQEAAYKAAIEKQERMKLEQVRLLTVTLLSTLSCEIIDTAGLT